MNSHHNHFAFDPSDHSAPSAPMPQPSQPVPMPTQLSTGSMGSQILEPQPQDAAFAVTYHLLRDLDIPLEDAPREFHGPLISNFLRSNAKHVQMPESVKELQDKAQRKYRYNVDARKRQQLDTHRQNTGRFQPTPTEMRKYTNRATAGAGKTKAQDLLKELTRFGIEQTDYSRNLISFLLRALQNSADQVRMLKDRLDATSTVVPVTSEQPDSQTPMNFPMQYEQNPATSQAFLSEGPEVVRNDENDHGNNSIPLFDMQGDNQHPVMISKHANAFEDPAPQPPVEQFVFDGTPPYGSRAA